MQIRILVDVWCIFKSFLTVIQQMPFTIHQKEIIWFIAIGESWRTILLQQPFESFELRYNLFIKKKLSTYVALKTTLKGFFLYISIQLIKSMMMEDERERTCLISNGSSSKNLKRRNINLRFKNEITTWWWMYTYVCSIFKLNNGFTETQFSENGCCLSPSSRSCFAWHMCIDKNRGRKVVFFKLTIAAREIRGSK
jgi:hypothetical protein